MKSKFKQIKHLNDAEFRRLTRVKRETFFKMLGILKIAQKKLKARGGRKSKLNLPHQLLLCLEYLREYRSLVHQSMGRRYADSKQRIFFAWQKGFTPKRYPVCSDSH